MRWLNYQHLFYFWNIARLGSVTEAARVLNLAQPTVSAQIKTFEEILGEKLFRREGKFLKLTSTGELAFKYADQIFALGQEFLGIIEGQIEHLHEELRIGISDVVPKILAYKLIEPAINFHNNVTVCCTEDKTENLLANLTIGELDLVISDRPIPNNVKIKAFNHFIGESSISFLGKSSFKKMLGKKFPNMLNSSPMLLPTKEAAIRWELDSWFESMGIKPQCVAEFQDRALMKIAAKDGKGIVAIPSVIAKEVARDFDLIILGTTPAIKEKLYLISVERKIKNTLIIDICKKGQENIFFEKSR